MTMLRALIRDHRALALLLLACALAAKALIPQGKSHGGARVSAGPSAWRSYGFRQ